MHSNVYTFDDSHHINKSSYVKQQPFNAYCGMISIYNFLTDSFQYKRGNDLGLLIARIFINQENHFFVEGKRHLGIDFNDFDNDLIDSPRLTAIVEAAILHCLNFDIQTPPFDKVGAITVQEVMEKELATVVSTGKRLGFKFQSESDGGQLIFLLIVGNYLHFLYFCNLFYKRRHNLARSSRGLGHLPFTEETRVRFPYGATKSGSCNKIVIVCT
jgi:hypothetical protein